MKHFARTAIAAAMFLVLAASAANASSPHFKRGGTPACRDAGTALECTGSLAGLGNENLTFILQADSFGTFACRTPSGKNEPYGQNKVYFPVNDVTSIDASEIKNGSLNFTISAPDIPPTATPQQAGCPSTSWSTRLVDLEFSNISLEIQQPTGTAIFTCSRAGAVSSTFQTLTCQAG